jgi:hypothetical protein
MKYDSFPTEKQAFWGLSDRAKLWVSCEEYFGNMGQEKAVRDCASLAKKYSQGELMVEVDQYKDRLNTLTERQVKFVAYYAAWWAGLSLIMYIIAISIKWVYRGFRPKKA